VADWFAVSVMTYLVTTPIALLVEYPFTQLYRIFATTKPAGGVEAKLKDRRIVNKLGRSRVGVWVGGGRGGQLFPSLEIVCSTIHYAPFIRSELKKSDKTPRPEAGYAHSDSTGATSNSTTSSPSLGAGEADDPAAVVGVPSNDRTALEEVNWDDQEGSPEVDPDSSESDREVDESWLAPSKVPSDNRLSTSQPGQRAMVIKRPTD
ncbi:hypothetical protein EVAR_62636_1, partial [Eumeta japonica]